MNLNRVGEASVVAIEEAGQFAVLVDGEPVPLLSLPPGVFDKIQQDSGLRWFQTLTDPTGNLSCAMTLVKAAEAKAGVGHREDEPDIASLLRRFVEIPSDLPPAVDVYTDDDENPTSASSTVG